MAAERTTKLFDQNWSENPILTGQRETSDSPPQELNPEFLGNHERENREKLPLQAPENVPIKRSLSDQNLMSPKATSFFGSSSDHMFSPKSVLNVKAPAGKLQTILSGKQVDEFPIEDVGQQPEREEEEENKNKKKKKEEGVRRRKKGSKSLSELEYEEIKGFMDLGFVFPEEARKDSGLVSILPGLQRLGKKENYQEDEENRGRVNEIPRPYLSEAWEYWGEGKVRNPSALAIEWRVPVTGNEVDMKENLKLWAHTVASTIR